MYGKELRADEASRIELPANIDTFQIELSEIYLRNLHMMSETVSVPINEIVEIEGRLCEQEKMIPAKRFIFNEGHIRSLLFRVLEATGQLDNLEKFVDSGGVINRPDGESFGGGFDIIIRCKE
ncbi:MAG: hypothetical protein UV60_C0001G0037 [Parcubacteria group bacterium GW2011_GWA2_43_11]|nr:MAG: hypothetical protein UU89_C0025G0021 [Parcubacteria group bacterium GW2011_GWC2_42_11]KKS86438.1 MAG: hypothetical protein UV60_C0001G0037 [Parcubacteria group bacterium GW2011_GWA2_43_11]